MTATSAPTDKDGASAGFAGALRQVRAGGTPAAAIGSASVPPPVPSGRAGPGDGTAPATGADGAAPPTPTTPAAAGTVHGARTDHVGATPGGTARTTTGIGRAKADAIAPPSPSPSGTPEPLPPPVAPQPVAFVSVMDGAGGTTASAAGPASPDVEDAAPASGPAARSSTVAERGAILRAKPGDGAAAADGPAAATIPTGVATGDPRGADGGDGRRTGPGTPVDPATANTTLDAVACAGTTTASAHAVTHAPPGHAQAGSVWSDAEARSDARGAGVAAETGTVAIAATVDRIAVRVAIDRIGTVEVRMTRDENTGRPEILVSADRSDTLRNAMADPVSLDAMLDQAGIARGDRTVSFNLTPDGTANVPSSAAGATPDNDGRRPRGQAERHRGRDGTAGGSLGIATIGAGLGSRSIRVRLDRAGVDINA